MILKKGSIPEIAFDSAEYEKLVSFNTPMEMVDYNGMSLGLLPMKSRLKDICLHAVWQNADALKYVPDKWKNHFHEIILKREAIEKENSQLDAKNRVIEIQYDGEKRSIEISPLFILSLPEYKMYREYITNSKQKWWLRSPGYDYGVITVGIDGITKEKGESVSSSMGVRPAFYIVNGINVEAGWKTNIAEKYWTAIDNNLLLCDSILRKKPYMNERRLMNAWRNMESVCLFHKSSVYQYLREWEEEFFGRGKLYTFEIKDDTPFVSVTRRIQQIKQPYGGFLNPSMFKKEHIEDGKILNEYSSENIHSGLVGTCVDYLSRFMVTKNAEEAFAISLEGAAYAHHDDRAVTYIQSINGIDDQSIISACKLVSFDVWKRNLLAAFEAPSDLDIHPDTNTIENIRIMVNRTLSFIHKHGPVIENGFTFENTEKEVNIDEYHDILETKGVWGGYTKAVSSGDGDLITKDAMWDLKVTAAKLNSSNTLQILMYWIMGKHSHKQQFQGIRKLGFFYPRTNDVYTIDVDSIPQELIELIEKNIICYPN